MGRRVGDLVATNTLGAIAGALSAGFLLLDLLGLWASFRLMAVLYLLAAFVIAEGAVLRVSLRRAAPAGTLLALFSFLDASPLPSLTIDPAAEDPLRPCGPRDASRPGAAPVRRPEGGGERTDRG